jgi:hypothetical protein
LRIGRWILRGIRQRHRRPIDQTHRTTLPVPHRRGTLGDQPPGVAAQPGHPLKRQALSCLAVRPGVGAAARQATYPAFDRRIVHRLLAGAVRRERLRKKHRQRLGGRKQPLTVLGQQRFDLLEQARAGEQVEKRVGIRVGSLMTDPSLLLNAGAMARMHEGWLPG